MSQHQQQQQLHYRTNNTANMAGGGNTPLNASNNSSMNGFPEHKSTGYDQLCCIECYNPNKEKLEYDYQYDDTNKPPQPYPRIRERGEYYIDTYNDQPWSWSFGTNERVSSCLFEGDSAFTVSTCSLT